MINGKFKITLTDSITGEVKYKSGFKNNLVLNNIFHPDIVGYIPEKLTCVFGTSGEPPLSTDTELGSKVNGGISLLRSSALSNMEYDFGAESYFKAYYFTGKSSPGDIKGSLRELGLENNGILFTKSLISLDFSGIPATVSVGPNDVIEIFYIINYNISSDLFSDLAKPIYEQNVNIKGKDTLVTTRILGYVNGTGAWEYQPNMSPLQPPQSFYLNDNINHIKVYTGDINDFEFTVGGGLTEICSIPNSIKPVFGDGLHSVTESDSNLVVPPGQGTGVWDNIVFTETEDDITSPDGTPVFVMTLTPPLIKTDSDTVNINNLKIMLGNYLA